MPGYRSRLNLALCVFMIASYLYEMSGVLSEKLFLMICINSNSSLSYHKTLIRMISAYH